VSTDPECIFCQIIEARIPSFRLYEDDHSLAFMDINPAHEGHALVIPRQHAPDLYHIEDEHLGAVIRTARKVAVAVKAALQPDGLNLVQCNGKAAAQSVFHFHIHVLPRSYGDNLALNWGLVPGDMEAIGALTQRIKAHF